MFVSVFQKPVKRPHTRALRKMYFKSCVDLHEETLFLTRTELHFTGDKFCHPSEYSFFLKTQSTFQDQKYEVFKFFLWKAPGAKATWAAFLHLKTCIDLHK